MLEEGHPNDKKDFLRPAGRGDGDFIIVRGPGWGAG
jgi:hypothetical protein